MLIIGLETFFLHPNIYSDFHRCNTAQFGAGEAFCSCEIYTINSAIFLNAGIITFSSKLFTGSKSFITPQMGAALPLPSALFPVTGHITGSLTLLCRLEPFVQRCALRPRKPQK